MQVHELSQMVGGWFVGHFRPTAVHSDQFEVAIKQYRAGDKEPKHHHRVAWEITAIATGSVRMCGRVFGQGSIVHLAPGESTDFEALEDCLTVVVKSPSVPADKFLD